MLVIEPESRTPPYEQLRAQLTTAINSGELAAGAKLPTVRRLAADLGVAPNTVARTYLELERARLIETRGRQGSFVAGAAEPTPESAEAGRAADDFVRSVRQLGIGDAAALRLIQKSLGATGS